MLNNFRNLSVIRFRGLFQNVKTRNTRLSGSRAYVFQRICAYPNAVPKECLALSCSNPIKECVRYESKDKSKGSQRQEYESDSDDEDEDEMNDVDEQGRQIIHKGKLHSLRLDNVVMKVFGLTRRKTEELLMGSHVIVNDSVAIKSYEVKINDVLELKEINRSFMVKNKGILKLEIIKIKPDFVNKSYDVFFVAL